MPRLHARSRLYEFGVWSSNFSLLAIGKIRFIRRTWFFSREKAVLKIKLLGKGLTQEISGDRCSYWWAPPFRSRFPLSHTQSLRSQRTSVYQETAGGLGTSISVKTPFYKRVEVVESQHLCTAADGDGLFVWEVIIFCQREKYLCLLEGNNNVAIITFRSRLFKE